MISCLTRLREHHTRTVALKAVCLGAALFSFGASGATAATVSVDGGQTVTVTTTQPSPWGTGDWLNVGNVSTGTVLVESGGQVTLLVLDIGTNAGSEGKVTISGPGSSVTTTAQTTVGDAGKGTLEIVNGGQAYSGVGVFIGRMAGAEGIALVDGANSTWTINGNLSVGNGSAGNGTLTVRNGGRVTSAGTSSSISGYGTASIEGAGSTWDAGNVSITVGLGGVGTLNILDGGQVLSRYGALGQHYAGSTLALVAEGTVVVDGAGSAWTMATGLYIGASPELSAGTRGTITVRNGGAVNAPTGIYLARDANTVGIVNVGAAAGQAAVAPGVLNVPTISFGNGTSRLVFNHNDTSGNYSLGAAITGSSGMDATVEVYNGTTVMTGASTYYAPTTVYGGTLAAGNSNVFSRNSDYDVRAGGTLDLMGHDQTVQSLANAGTVRIASDPGAVLTVTGAYTSNGRLSSYRHGAGRRQFGHRPHGCGLDHDGLRCDRPVRDQFRRSRRFDYR